MMIKVKTLTGKEIEIDIDGTDKIERIKERVEEKEGRIDEHLSTNVFLVFRNSSTAATLDLQRPTNGRRENCQ